LGAILISILALIGHAYTIESLYGVADYSKISVFGALSNMGLALGVLLLRPEKGLVRMLVTRSAAGVMSRLLYGPIVLLPPVLGFLALVSAEVWRWYDLPFGVALFAIMSILLLAAVIAFTSVRLERTDLSRAKAEEDLGRSIAQLEDSRMQLRDLSAHIQEVHEEERLRIAREVHDELGQSLTAIKMDIALLRTGFPQQQSNGSSHAVGENDESIRRIDSMLTLVNSTIHTVQRISSELRPSLLDDLGLAAALDWQAREFERRSHIPVTLHVEEVTLDRSSAIAVFRIFQETLTNIARHANAEHVEISLRYADNMLQMRVHDDGVGFDPMLKGQVSSLGLVGMRERAALAGGTLTIDSTPGGGTTILLDIPNSQIILAA
jgi:signal transduction histidine kinase